MCSTERWADPPFIDIRRDGVHVQGIVEVVVFSPNRGGAVFEHCGKYTVGYGADRVKASRPLIRVLVINDNGLWINEFI